MPKSSGSRQPAPTSHWTTRRRQTGTSELTGSSGLGCYSDGQSSLPVRMELSNGDTLTSMLGYTLSYNTLSYNTLGNNKARLSYVVRSSVGVSLIWASPVGPLRFD